MRFSTSRLTAKIIAFGVEKTFIGYPDEHEVQLMASSLVKIQISILTRSANYRVVSEVINHRL